MAENVKLNVRIEYEQQREAILKTLKEAGYEHVRILDDDRKNFKDRFKSLGGDYKAALAMVLGRDFNLLDMAFKLSTTTTRQLGREGGFGAWGESLGKSLGRMLGEAAGDSPASKEALGAIGEKLIEGGVKIYNAYEMRRMIGARVAPIVSAGQETQTEGFFSTGQSYINRVIEIQQMTGATAQEVEGVLTELSRVGIAFKGSGSAATAYALATDKLLNLQKGVTAELEATAVKQYGEGWEKAADVIQLITAATQYWHSVGVQTKNANAEAIASNQNLLTMYKQVQQATKNTSFSMEGMTQMLLASIGTMHQFGVRPGMMAGMTGEFLSSIAPKAGSMHETIQHGFFLNQLLDRSAEGQAIRSKTNALSEQLGLDPTLFSNVALNQLLSSEPGMTTRFGGAVLRGLARERNLMPGSNNEAKNTQMLFKMEAFMPNMSTTGRVLALRMSEEYERNIAIPGTTEEQAMAATAASQDVKDLIAGSEFKGMGMDEIFKRLSGISHSTFSSAESLQMAAEKLSTTYLDDKYWPKMEDAIFQGLLKSGRISAETPGIGGGLAVGAMIGRKKQEAPVKATEESTNRLVASYTKNTASGVTQVATYFNEGVTGTTYPPGSPEAVNLFKEAAREAGVPESWATDPALQELLRKESSGRVGIPNYTYGKNLSPEQIAQIQEDLRAGKRTTSSSATGLGQLTLANVDQFYPGGRSGIGNPRSEAVGMLRYISNRYGTPAQAMSFHSARGWY